MYLRLIKNMIEAKFNPTAYLKRIGVKIGINCKVYSLHPGAFGSEPYLIEIGNNVIITAGVRIITHDGSTFLFRDEYPNLDVMGPVKIKDNCFIGMNSIILPGVTIGANCVVGAMSVVTRSVPDGCVIAGNPAKILMSTEEFKVRLLKKNSETGSMSFTNKRDTLLSMTTSYDASGRSWLIKEVNTDKNEY